MLVVTLFGASEIKKATTFFLELYTEPQEAAAKVSSTKMQASGKVSLDMERLELDWYGDEAEVAIVVVEYPANYLGELRIPRDKILQYAKEAAASPDDLKSGSRSFAVERIDPQVAKLRNRRKKAPPPDNVVVTWALAKAQTTISQLQGKVDMGNDHGVADNNVLKSRNKDLEAEVDYLKKELVKSGSMSTYQETTQAFQDQQATKKDIIMNVVMRFQLMPKKPPENVNVLNLASIRAAEADFNVAVTMPAGEGTE
jgi:hypothetical protein